MTFLQKLQQHLITAWYQGHPLFALLLPFAWVYESIVRLRRAILKPKHFFSVPIIVVGNITVGGTGKTPFTIWLAKQFVERGFRVGLVSQGYRGRLAKSPHPVKPEDDPTNVGDEALLLATKTQCPVFIGQDRAEAVKKLLEQTDCEIVISDDGLQHYRLSRSIEIALADEKKGFGSRHCLPAGPLREPLSRLKAVDFLVMQGEPSNIGRGVAALLKQVPQYCENLASGEKRSCLAFAGQTVHGVAGIAHPSRFFKTLVDLGMVVIEHPFWDHRRYKRSDLAFGTSYPIIMTEKDAVKCRHFGLEDTWALVAETEVFSQTTPPFLSRLIQLLQQRGYFTMDHRLLDILVCPLCKGSLVYRKTEQELICKFDKLAFPIRDDIPVMLEQEARKVGLEELERL